MKPGAASSQEQVRSAGYRYDRKWIVDRVRLLSVIDDRYSAVQLILQWALILGTGALAIRLDSIPAFVLAGLFIGTRLQRLAVMMHDACHRTLFSNRKVNDWVGDLFVSYPLGISIELYRASHMRHHRHTNTAQDYDYRFQSSDPDQRFPRSAGGMAWLLVRSLLGLNLPRMFWFARVWIPLANLHNPGHLDIDFSLASRLRYLAWLTVVLAGAIASPWTWQILGLWLIPLFVWSNLFNRMRAMAEHNGVADSRELDGTRTVIPSFLDRLFIVPYNVSYHLEHHLFPSVPGPNLKRLHEELQDDDEYRRRAHVTRGYWGMIRELMAGEAR